MGADNKAFPAKVRSGFTLDNAQKQMDRAFPLAILEMIYQSLQVFFSNERKKLAANMATSLHHHLLFWKSALETAANLIELLKRTVAYLDLSTAIAMIDFNLHAGNIGKQLFQRLGVGVLFNRARLD